MSHEHKIVPALLEPAHKVRYLKLIALFKIGKGVLCLALGVSILFVNSRSAWMDRISDWTDTEILLGHSRPVMYLLHRLDDWMAGGHLRAIALLALFYCGVLFTEGIGVYMQKRWAEYLMICATAALIPFEVRHLWHHPSMTAVLILLANCFVVWFLYLVLQREKPEHPSAQEKELIETR